MTAARWSNLVLAALLTAALGACPRAPAQGIRCGAGQDLVVQALERITPQSGDDAFEDALELLKHAISICPELGDAWYYRSLVEKRLGHDALANYAMDKARFNGSEALDQGLNPLVLSTPASRGFDTGGRNAGTRRSSRASRPGAAEVGAGCGHRPASPTREIPSLNYTDADAKAFAAALKDPNIGGFPADNVHVLTDDQATTKNIKEELNWIARHAQPNDLVVIYVATHGTPRTARLGGRRQLPGHLRHRGLLRRRLRRRRTLRHGISHGGVGQRRRHAHEGPAHGGLSRHLLQRRRSGERAASPAQSSPTPPPPAPCWRT